MNALLSCLLLAGGLMQAPTVAGGVLCAQPGQQLELQVDLYDTARLRVIEADGGRVVAQFDSGEPGASRSWVSTQGDRTCYRLAAEWPALAGAEALCLVNDGTIAYAVDAKSPLTVRVRYRGGRWEARDIVCAALPEVRAAHLPSVASEPSALSGDLPAFPWPPPAPTTRRTLDRHLVVGNNSVPTLGQVADRLQAALEACGYVEYSYYRLRPGGFALATRLERIHPDGRPMDVPKRWEITAGPLTRFELGEYLRALFDAERGHFRVIVFAVTSGVMVPGPEPPSVDTALRWPHEGGSVLPEAVRRLPYGSGFHTHALIYEFETRGRGQQADFKPRSVIAGDAHLRRAGLMAALERGN